jgi:alpha-1,3-glucan synthase
MGLGAPRWCQILWSTSRLGAFIPWVGGAVTSSFLTRALWLWLGVLDNVQGLGFGVILLQTLTRHHNTFVLACAQAAGSISIILGKAVRPSTTTLFPNLAEINLDSHSLSSIGPWFYLVFILQAGVCVMFIWGYRREQLWRP